MNNRDRVMILSIPKGTLLNVLEGRIRIVDLDLPTGVRIVNVDFNPLRRCFDLLLEHPSFELCPMGQEPQRLPPLTLYQEEQQ